MAKASKKIPVASFTPHLAYNDATKQMAQALDGRDVYAWLAGHGYFPESYMLPPCFAVLTRPRYGLVYRVAKNGRDVPRQDLTTVRFS